MNVLRVLFLWIEVKRARIHNALRSFYFLNFLDLVCRESVWNSEMISIGRAPKSNHQFVY